MSGKQILSILMVIIIILITIILIFVLSRDRIKPAAEHEIYNAPDLTGKKVTVLTNRPHLEASEILADWFQQETGAVVRNIVVDYTEMCDYIIDDASSLNPRLDVVMFWYVDIGKLAEYGALLDLTEVIQKNSDILKPDDYIPSLYAPYTQYNNRKWALPFDGDTHLLFYRKSILKNAGFNPPETWDEYQLISKTITENERKNGIFGTAIMAPPQSMLIISSFMNRLGSFGGNLLNENGVPVINSKEALTALTAMVDHTRYALPTPYETDWEVSRDAFLTGRIAMVEQWTDIGIMAEDISQSSIMGDWGAVKMPKGSGNKSAHVPALNSGFSLGIAKNSQNHKAAEAYLLFACSPAVTLKLNLINGGIDPVRLSVLESAEYIKFAPILSSVAQWGIKRSIKWPTIPEASILLDILTENLAECINGIKDPAQTLDDTRKQWEAILNKAGR